MNTLRSYGVLIGLLVATLALTAWTGKVSGVSESGLAMVLPAELSGWRGASEPPSELERRGLPPDTEFERRRYWDAEGRELFVSIVLAGKHSQSIHRPETCLPSQGWSITDAHYETVALEAPAQGALTVRALKIAHPGRGGTSGPVERLCYYWFMGKDRLTASHFERIFLTSYDRLVHNVNHRWAYITVSAVVPPAGNLAESRTIEHDARRRVQTFVARLFPRLMQPALTSKD